MKIENKLFRAWGKYTKKMYNVAGMNWSDDNIISEICIDTGNERVYRDATNYIIMQYSGIEDCNDVMAYEGDIIQYFAKSEKNNVNYDSSYISNPGLITFGKLREGYDNYHICFMTEDCPLNDEYCNFVIIGNKYENPELLNIDIPYEKRKLLGEVLK